MKRHIWQALGLGLMMSSITGSIVAQGVLPIHRYVVQTSGLDAVDGPASFGYSLRKVGNTYTGPSIKVRRGGDNAEGNVAFDSLGIVSANSLVTITASGTSGLAVGQVLSYSAFKGAQTVFVTTWYDQGPTHYQAVQTNTSQQPTLELNSAASNTKPSILFSGGKFFVINQPIENILANGISGSFLVVIKPTQNIAQESFGHWKTTWQATNHWRWSFHVNWSDGYAYFDAAEYCCATHRNFLNASNINLYKQYSFVRGASYKTVRINGVPTTLNNAPAASVPSTGGAFYIGWAQNALDNTFYGNMSEVLMFPRDLSSTELSNLEADQVAYWGL